MSAFQYHPEILNSYPQLRAAVIYAKGVTNLPASPELASLYQQGQEETIARLGDQPLSEVESLAAWRSAFRSFGVNPTRYRSAPEALLRRLTKKGDIPSINSLVDICNLVSIRYALPVAAFDRGAIKGAIQVRYAQGDETFIPLGVDEVEHPEPGEVIFVDSAKQVVARRWCWRQNARSAAGMGTRDVILTIEAMHENSLPDVTSAHEDVLALLAKYLGGSYNSDIIYPS